LFGTLAAENRREFLTSLGFPAVSFGQKSLFDLRRLRLDSYRISESKFLKNFLHFLGSFIWTKKFVLFKLLAAGVMLKFQRERL